MERKQLRKYDRKTLIYMLITGVCLLAGIFLIMKMVLSGGRAPVHDPYSISGVKAEAPGTSGRDGEWLRISGEQAATAIGDSLAGILPLKDVKAVINDNYTADISGTASKGDIERLIENGGIDAPPLIEVAIGFLPEEVTLSAVLGIELDMETGRLNASLQSLKISGIDIDTVFLPENSEDAINNALNSFVEEGGAIQSLEIRDGVMHLQTN